MTTYFCEVYCWVCILFISFVYVFLYHSELLVTLLCLYVLQCLSSQCFCIILNLLHSCISVRPCSVLPIYTVCIPLCLCILILLLHAHCLYIKNKISFKSLDLCLGSSLHVSFWWQDGRDVSRTNTHTHTKSSHANHTITQTNKCTMNPLTHTTTKRFLCANYENPSLKKQSNAPYNKLATLANARQ